MSSVATFYNRYYHDKLRQLVVYFKNNIFDHNVTPFHFFFVIVY